MMDFAPGPWRATTDGKMGKKNQNKKGRVNMRKTNKMG